MRKGVMRPGHVQIRVLDMDEAIKHYVELLGLIEMDRDDQPRVPERLDRSRQVFRGPARSR